MSLQNNDFYTRLKQQLLDSSSWPCIYKFKFILKTDLDNISVLKKIFNEIDANFTSRLSTSKNFTSVTITAKMKSPDQIIEKYKSASIIKGIISL